MCAMLGPNPRGTDVMVALYIAEQTLSGVEDDAVVFERADMTVDVPRDFVRSLMSASVRFGIEESAGVLHISYYLLEDSITQDESTEVQNEMGWATRFVLQAICNNGKRVGANFSESELDGLFADLEPVGEDNGGDPSYQLYSNDPITREVQSRVEDEYNEMERKATQSRIVSEERKGENADLMARIDRMEQRMQTMLSLKENHTIRPDDSSSNIDRYEKRYMPHGTILRPGESALYNVGKGGTKLAIEQSILTPCITKDIVRGFVKTRDMHDVEQKALKKTYPINGLARPFVSQRLNILCHFHTAIENVLPKCGGGSYISMMSYMYKYKAKTPSEELAYQIVSRTFDMTEMVVVCNPFNLPLVEVGMQINDATLVKCFTLLKSEYRNLWFQQMKHMNVPDFYNEFNEFKENQFSRRTFKSNDRMDDKRSHQRGFVRKSNRNDSKPESVFSVITRKG